MLAALGALLALSWATEGRSQVVVVGQPAYTVVQPTSYVIPTAAVYETSAVTYAAPVMTTAYVPTVYEAVVPTAYVPTAYVPTAAYVPTTYASVYAPTSYVVQRRGLFGPRYRVYNVWP
jgi:hypothetical protein